MSRNTSDSLGDHFTDFLARQVASGRYGSASEVGRVGLRPREERETALEAQRGEIAKAEASGWIGDADIDRLLDHIRAGDVARA
jgi:antitoxin ParD1/3/4